MAKVVRCSWSLPSGDRESLNGPHTKILEEKKKKRKEKPNKGILLMVWCKVPMDMDVWDSHGCACEVDTWFS